MLRHRFGIGHLHGKDGTKLLYADSDGYSAKDLERKWAWKYRDYVVRSIQQDKPFDRFILEQVAGDELVTVTTIEARPMTTNAFT